MVQSNLGVVKLTHPNYELCEILHCSKSDVDNAVEATLGADISAILGALGDMYGTEHALKMWAKSAEIYLEILKGE